MLKQKFVSIDVETPNKQQNSICSLGITEVDENANKNELYFLINPETNFDIPNTQVHGITEKNVADAPVFTEIWSDVHNIFTSNLLVGHNIGFDLSCIAKTLGRYCIDVPPVYYIDTLSLSKKLLKDVPDYKLNTLCDYYNIKLNNHHNALEDSSATADLFLALCKNFDFKIDDYIKKYVFSVDTCKCKTVKVYYNEATKTLQELQGVILGITSDGELNNKEIFALKQWIDKHSELKGNYPYDRICTTIEKVLEDNIITEAERKELFDLFSNILNPVEADESIELDESIAGKTICLTGNFECKTKSEFSNYLERQNAIIKKNVTKNLDYLIVGGKGSDKWSQGNYGNKVKKALEFNEKGSSIKIITEEKFLLTLK